jgi:membrane protein DedA with SNARE-associated domain
MHEVIHRLSLWYVPLTDWYTQSLQNGGYPLIVLLMAIESSLLPLPSELVIPPAAYLAYTHRGNMSVVGVVIAGTLGSWIGATVMYWVSRWAGRPLIIRYGRYVFIPPEKVEQAERWSARFGSFGVFGSRLLPVIRHLIGIPSGIIRFNFARYSLYTVAGSLLWCAVLSAVSIAAGNNAKLMSGDLKTVTLWVSAAIVVLGALYYFLVYRFARDES